MYSSSAMHVGAMHLSNIGATQVALGLCPGDRSGCRPDLAHHTTYAPDRLHCSGFAFGRPFDRAPKSGCSIIGRRYMGKFHVPSEGPPSTHPEAKGRAC